MTKKGWVKIHRKMRDNPWMRKPAYRAVWLELLLEAAHEPRDIIWKGKRITLREGQLTCGAKQLSEWTGVPRGTVERILKTLKSEEQIEVESGPKFSLITVKNWTSYQKSEEQNEELVRNRRGTSEELVRTPKELNNLRIKEARGEKSPTPSQIAHEFFGSSEKQDETALFVSERKKIELEIVRAEIRKFVMYWTEPNKSGTKVRWQLQKTFDVQRRLITWFSRSKIDKKASNNVAYL